jgi:DNA mismatch endonuclease (patch repair protein)
MVDVLTPAQRHFNMSRISGKHTRPEMVVRSLVHRMGFRYRLHSRDLPGHPDLVLPRHQKVILVNGCFWHMHACRYGSVIPQTNAEFWKAKRGATRQRDRKNLRALEDTGWSVLTTRDQRGLERTLAGFLDGPLRT